MSTKKQQAALKAAGEALFGAEEAWPAPLARAMTKANGDDVQERFLRRAVMDKPAAHLTPDHMKLLRTLLQQRQTMITRALSKLQPVLE